MQKISEVVKNYLCISCGACMIPSDSAAFNWVFDKRYAMFVPRNKRSVNFSESDIAFQMCPGKGIDILRLSNLIRSPEANYDIQLGHILDAYAVRSTEESLLDNASSGGIVTGLAKHLLSTNKVSGVIATRFTYGPQGPMPEAFIARSIENLQECQGSKYCPVSVHEPLMKLKGKNERIAFIGTPCQIASVRMLMEKFDWLRDSIRYVIGNFCGGMKDYRNVDAIIKRQGIKPSEVIQFCFRGGGQPGRLLIRDSLGQVKTRPYPDYGTDTGFKKLERCRLCVDGTAELADIACGDAWIPRFLESGKSWSIAIVRNNTGAALLTEMVNHGLIETKEISLEEIKYSQRSNLSSKKKRQAARRRLYSLLGRPVPVYDGGFPETSTSLWLEAKVQLSHFLFHCLETLKVYYLFIKCARWLRGTNEFRKKGTKVKI